MTDTRMRLRRGLLVSLLAMSLAACAALPGGPAVSDRVDAAQRRARATADALDAWVARIAMLPLGTSMRQQVHGAEPNGRLIEYLAAILNEIPPRDVYGFEDPADMMKLITTARLALFRAVKEQPGSITDTLTVFNHEAAQEKNSKCWTRF